MGFRQRLFFRYSQVGIFCYIPFLPEPILHGFPELIERNARADLHLAIGNRKRVVESAEVRETPHGEGIEPLQRAGKRGCIVVVLDANAAREHESIKAYVHSEHHSATGPQNTELVRSHRLGRSFTPPEPAPFRMTPSSVDNTLPCL